MSKARMLTAGKSLLAICASGTVALASLSAQAQDPCLGLTDPAEWPAAARPYFMVLVDTSGSMAWCTTPYLGDYECNASAPGYQLNSCGMVPNRINDAKCALRQTVMAFGGQVNFGLSTFAQYLSGCPAGACQPRCGAPTGGSCTTEYYVGCTINNPPGGDYCGNNPNCSTGAGPAAPNLAENTWLNGANVVVPLLQDDWWAPPPLPTNIPLLLEWFDGNCDNSRELHANSGTPTAPAMRSIAQYLRSGWSRWTEDSANPSYCLNDFDVTHPTVLDASDRDCRSINVLFVTDGEPSDCETGSDLDNTVNVIADLYNTGVTLPYSGGTNWRVKTHVINFAGADPANTDRMADAGDDGVENGSADSLLATNEVTLAQGLSQIIASAIRPEECNNGDDNCNGCVDEGYLHYCNTGKPCCSWSTLPERDDCIADYEASVITLPPDGNLALLPCIDPAQVTDPARWLCYDPGEVCDEVDNNCQSGVDEGMQKCGNPPGCPTSETCNQQDDDCDGQIDEDGVCGDCFPTAEVCDGCDNDCDGTIDNGTFADLACGLPNPPDCLGVRVCDPAQPVPVEPGDCVPGAGYGDCTNNPGIEICNGIDDDCDGFIDDGLTLGSCVPSSHPGGLSYGPPAICELGTEVCDGVNGIVCVGGVGPEAEICDGIDNDCVNGVDDGTLPGEGVGCGTSTGECEPGVTDCVGGALVCGGGTPPTDEVCDGLDNDCDGAVDDAPLDDAPASPGCWTLPGNCCSHTGATGTVTWCPPCAPGQTCPPYEATCTGVGTLDPPCLQGTLRCIGAQGWECVNDRLPVAEVCDGIDNDCNGAVDDGDLPQVGDVCGTDVGECEPGQLICSNGILDCDGDVPPTPEICDGLDNDCVDGIDNGLPIGDPCTPVYDTDLYPGDRSFLPCQPGNLQCLNGGLECVGGLGPNPEICDGIDNDCDGTLDEAGAAPDGLDGTDNPVPPPDGAIGDSCGNDVGMCAPGELACVNGQFTCLGSVGPTPEQCDCMDNDCDGSTDELPGEGEPALCSPGKDCVNTGSFCVCAPLCSSGEYPCPTGQECLNLPVSGSDPPEVSPYCIPDFCDDCSTVTVVDSNGDPVCGPASLNAPGCKTVPECTCRGQVGCQAPCLNVACPEDTLCSEFGPNPGSCGPDSCYHMGCPGCDQACQGGECVENPCTPESCDDDQVCVPDFEDDTFACTGSCAGVECDETEQCIGGTCMEACDPPCSAEQYCDMNASGGPACVPNQCLGDGGASPCADGSCCDPVTGECGDCPCEGILCPEGQDCVEGQCTTGSGGTGGAGPGGAGPGGSGTGGAGTGGAGTGAIGPGPEGPTSPEVWRLPTGGGGCACRVGGTGGRAPSGALWLALAGIGLALGRARGLRSERLARLAVRLRRGPAGAAATLATLALLGLGAAGCDTDAYCFNCEQGVGNNGSGADAGVGGGGVGADAGVGGSGGECIFDCGGNGTGGGQGGGGPCVETNGGIEICDGLDNDCDGDTDEPGEEPDGIDFNHPSHCGTCQNNCLSGLPNVVLSTITCTWGGQEGQLGVCGSTDCTPGQPCGSGAGLCAESGLCCATDYWDLDENAAGCEYYCLASDTDDAVCNNKDDDCDGDVDEDVDLCASPTDCGVCGRTCSVINGTGECAASGGPPCDATNTECVIVACDDTDNDGIPNWHDDIASPAEDCNYPCEITGAGVELCNGLDDDCDGRIDGTDDLSGDARIGAACYGGEYGECHDAAHVGTTQCQAGQVVCTGPNVIVPNQLPELCNGRDDDCDNVVDDNPTDVGGQCGSSSFYPCSFGTEQCVNGVPTCVGNVEPGIEECNGIDDDCDGLPDLTDGNPPTPPADSVGPCNEWPTPDPLAPMPCVAGTKACVGGTIQCQNWTGPTATSDLCGEDSNCDGNYTWPGNTDTDVSNCGTCGNDCYADPQSAHTVITCVAGVCTFQGCDPNWYDFSEPPDQICETPCIPNGTEQCNNIDDDCDGDIDDGVTAPAPGSVCGTSPAAYSPECTTLVAVSCVNGSWECTFPANVCDGSNGCSNALERCDSLDNDCDGLINETWPNWNKACASDDGLPYPGDGACRTTGTFQCNTPTTVACSAVKASCTTLPGGCAEQCDGIDNDCDGHVDEYTNETGGDQNYFVKPAVVKIGTSLWAFAYEASRPNAGATTAGSGNGYHCACDNQACTSSGCTEGIPPAPAGIPLDETPACSVSGRIPWFNVSPAEAEQTCEAIGGFVCDLSEWRSGCEVQAAPNDCTWGYDPRNPLSTCTTGWAASKQCNLGPYDFGGVSGADGLLTTGYLQSLHCYADWSGLQGNGATHGACANSLCTGLFDITGNLREITFSAFSNGGTPGNPSDDTWDYRLMGGAFGTYHPAAPTTTPDGAACDFDFYSVSESFKLYDTGFRCCFDSNPLL